MPRRLASYRRPPFSPKVVRSLLIAALLPDEIEAIAPPDGALTLLSPLNGESLPGGYEMFTWSAGGAGARYRIQIATDSAFSNIVDESLALLPAYAATLDPDTAYFWRVREENIFGVGDWSTQRVVLPYWQPRGFGASATGGVGGTLHLVTNTNDSGAGSLRAALTASGTRLVVVTASGVCTLASRIDVNNGNLTVYCLTDFEIEGATVAINTSNYILRNLRIRPGDDAPGSPSTIDALQVNGSNGMIDHCSLSFSQDEICGIGGCNHVTMQNCVLSYAMGSDYGLLVRDDASYITVLNNLFAHNGGRNPFVKGDLVEVVNNVAYNGGYGMSSAAEQVAQRVNFIGNYIKAGLDTYPTNWQSAPILNIIDTTLTGTETLYLRGNRGYMRQSDALPESDGVYWGFLGQTLSPTQIAMTEVSDNATTAESAMTTVLANAGAFPRSALDQKTIDHVSTGTAWRGIAGNQVSTDTLAGYTIAGTPVITAPANGSVVTTGDTPTFTWTIPYGDPAPTYTLEVASDSGFSTIIYSATGISGLSHTVGSALPTSVTLYARVTAYNPLATGGVISSTTSFGISVLPEGYHPADDGTLIICLDSRQGVFADTGAVTPITNGVRVKRWNDLGGNNNHVTQSIDVATPVYNATGLNGTLPEILFESEDALWVADNNTLTPTSGMLTFYYVIRAPLANSPGYVFSRIGEYSSRNSSSRWYIGLGSTTQVQYVQATTGLQLVRGRFDGSTAYVKRTGVVETSAGYSTPISNTASRLVVGAYDYNGSNGVLNCGLGLLLIFDGNLSAEAQLRVEAWIQQEFGVSL